MLKPPTKTSGGLKRPTALPKVSSGIGGVKRKIADNTMAATGLTTSNNPSVRNIENRRPTKAPISRSTKSGVETVSPGRQSSKGFKVTPKRDLQQAPVSKLPAGRRIPASRTVVTKGRPAAGPTVNCKTNSIPVPNSGKRRRVGTMTSSAIAQPAHAMGGFGGVYDSPTTNSGATQGGANMGDGKYNSSDTEGEDDDGDDIGPPPVLYQRPDNDVKGRLKDLEAWSAYMIKKNRTTRKKKKLLSVELEQNTTHVTQLEYEKNMLEAKAEELEMQVKVQKKEIEGHQDKLRATTRQHEDDLDDAKRKLARKTEEMKDDYTRLKSTWEELKDTYEATKNNLQTKKDECVRLEGTISKQASDQLELESNSRSLKAKLEKLEDTLNEREVRIAELEESVASRSHTIDELESKLRTEETVRRKLHNTIQELRGNIRVFCRVRPLMAEEKDASGSPSAPITFPDCEDQNEIELVQSSENALGKTTLKKFPFKFDRVFEPDLSQDVVFDEVSQLIQSALDGYPVCIFAYGQTGSGKTHTMQGPDSITEADMSEKALGIIPRAVRQIYETTSKLSERGWEYTLEGQFLEIYNETLQDLLAPPSSTSSSSSRNSNGDKQAAKLEIYQDSEGHTRVKNVTTVRVDSAKRVNWLLARAAENRTVAATNCNERSSRSHSVFTLSLHGKNALTGESSSGILNLIDLAGSERLSSSGSSGDRLKETQAINKSLACLGDVIAALAKGSRHIPYRNSKLTHMLQESLGAGNSKTLMFVCVNPSQTSLQESLCSLQFATKVNSCQIGTARRQASA